MGELSCGINAKIQRFGFLEDEVGRMCWESEVNFVFCV